MSQEHLEPCPFCGSELRRERAADPFPLVHSAEDAEGCLLHGLTLDDADDLTYWNWRTPPPAYGQMKSALEDAPYDPLNAVAEADGRLASFVAALNGAGGHDAKRELWLQAIDDGQFESDLRVLFGPAEEIALAHEGQGQ